MFLFPVSEEPWDTEWAEPEGLATLSSRELTCFFHDYENIRMLLKEN